MTTLAHNRWNGWRVARWSAGAVLLLIPLAMMQVDSGWNWGVGDFVFAAAMIGSCGLLYDFAASRSHNFAYRAGIAVLLTASFLTVWTTLVRDDGTGIGYFTILMAAAVGGFAAWFQAAGMARAMLGVAAMQGIVGLLIATAPSTANTPMGPIGVLLFNAFFVLLWLLAAGLFRHAARSGEAT